MTATTQPSLPATVAGPSTLSRVYGLGSIYAKTLRDSRRAFFIATGLLTFLFLTGGAAIAGAFGTVETRAQAASLAEILPPIFQGLLGRPIGLTTLGGFIEWRYVVLFFILIPIWSILALSSTLAGEATRGSLELAATSGLSRRRIALEKLFGHLTAVALALILFAITIWVTGQVFATLPGDEIPVAAAIGYAAITAVMILLPGAVAFAAAPFIGRGAGAGLAALVMLASYFVNGFRDSIPAFDAVAPLSYFAWTFDHVPLAGLYDWGSLVLPTVLSVVLLAIGVLGFERRDMASTIRVPSPHLPRFLVGLKDPLGRAFGERIPMALAWGIGLGLYVLVLSTGADSMTELFERLPVMKEMINAIYPNADMTSVGGLLQIVFVEFGLLITGFAAATLVGGWASDETSGRLEVILSNPLTRASWLIRSGLGVYLAILLSTAIVAGATALGSASQGSDALTPTIGSFVLALYGMALAGIGIAAAGLFRSSMAAAVVIVMTVGTFLITIFAAPLKLPDWVADLALSAHYGSPLLGDWDAVGIVASLVLAIGGLAVGAWGLSRRDVRV
jgi:ABC-2 type transport system permease protein